MDRFDRTDGVDTDDGIHQEFNAERFGVVDHAIGQFGAGHVKDAGIIVNFIRFCDFAAGKPFFQYDEIHHRAFGVDGSGDARGPAADDH